MIGYAKLSSHVTQPLIFTDQHKFSCLVSTSMCSKRLQEDVHVFVAFIVTDTTDVGLVGDLVDERFWERRRLLKEGGVNTMSDDRGCARVKPEARAFTGGLADTDDVIGVINGVRDAQRTKGLDPERLGERGL